MNESILQEAERIINGPKRQEWGPAEASFARIAQIWSGVLGTPVTAHQVCLCMVGLKLYRESNHHTRDSLVDLAGYAELANKIASSETDK